MTTSGPGSDVLTVTKPGYAVCVVRPGPLIYNIYGHETVYSGVTVYRIDTSEWHRNDSR